MDLEQGQIYSKDTATIGKSVDKLSEKEMMKMVASSEFAGWVEAVCKRMLPENSFITYIFSAKQLEASLEREDPERWQILKMVMLKYKWRDWCTIHKGRFVWNGSERGQEYLSLRKPENEGNCLDPEQPILHASTEVLLRTGRFHIFSPCFAAIGFLLNYFWCLFGFVLPNCCCAWRWVCFQAGWPCQRYWKYTDIESQIQTGDLLLFSGAFQVRIGAQSHWSHIGVACRDDKGEHGPPGLLYVMEANFTEGGWDHCDLRLLRERCATYKSGASDVSWKPLIISEAQRDAISKSIAKWRGEQYDHDLKRMALAALDCCPCCEKKQEQRRAMFCSQLAAQLLIDAGVLEAPPLGPPANEYLPRDFSLLWGGTAENAALRKVLGPSYIIRRPKDTWTGHDLR